MIKIISKITSLIIALFISTSAIADSWPVALSDTRVMYPLSQAGFNNSRSIVINVLGNDIGTNLLVTEANSWSQKGGRVSLGTDTADRAGNASYLVLYTPPDNFTGDDVFWYVIKDYKGRTNAAKVTVTILAESTRFPNPIGDTVAVQKDKSIRINVLANDVFRGSEGTISQFNDWSEKGGQIKIDENSELIYTPPSGFTGTDTFWYAIKDSVNVTGQPIEHAAKVTIDVSDANQAGPYPITQEDFVNASSSCNPRGACARNLNKFFVTTNDTGKNLKVSSGSAFSMNGGSVRIVPSNLSLTTYIYYVPSVRAIEEGSDKIWYVIEDEVGRKNWGVVNITVLE